MEEGFCDRHWELVESQVVKPFRRYKAMRNNSMPDLCDLAGTPSPAHAAERQFAYNKWFIRPEQRLKRKPVGLRSSLQLHPGISPHPAAPLFYESLYSLDELSLRPPEETREKEAALRRICADGQNLKLLATFRKYPPSHAAASSSTPNACPPSSTTSSISSAGTTCRPVIGS